MNLPISKTIGSLMLLVGIVALLAVVAVALFFVGLFLNIDALLVMGAINDVLNASASILTALLAAALYPHLRRLAPRMSLVVVIGVWLGALAHTSGSWLIMTDRSGVELSSYSYFTGNGLIGIWLWLTNRVARQDRVWPRHLAPFGLIASGFLMIGLIGAYGVLFRLDGDDYSPLVMVAGISFLGMGFLYPIWCIRLSRWIMSKQPGERLVALG